MEIKTFDDGTRYVESFFTVNGKKVKYVSYTANAEETNAALLERHTAQVDLGGYTLVEREVINDAGLIDAAPEGVKQRHKQRMDFLKSALHG